MAWFRVRHTAIAVVVAVAAGACTFSEYKPPPLEGPRVPVMVLDTGVKPDPQLAAQPVAVAPPTANAAWLTQGGKSDHAMYHVALGPNPRRVFRVSAGRGASEEERLLAQPVADGQGRVFVLDVLARITAIDARTGNRLWRRGLRGDEDSEGTLGGGMAVSGGRLFISTGFAQLIALDASNGKLLWRRRFSAPFRSAPTVADDRVFAVSSDNQTHALSVATGEVLWTHRGAAELASLLGGASPAYEAGTVVVAYSTGEIFGLRASNGSELWTDYLARTARSSAVAQIADIRASPVIDRGRVIAVSNSGRMVALNLASGQRIWEQRVSSIQLPWVAGPYVYVVTTDSVLLCMSRADGRVRWARSVPRWDDPRRQRGLITWAGPILAGNRLILAGSNRDLLSVSPYNGDLLGRIRLPDPVSVPPIVAGNTLYVWTDDADLVAWR